MAELIFQEAKRKAAKARIAICGPSGAGKTESSLILAGGLAGANGKIALLDTEAGSSQIAAGKSYIPKFSILVMNPPFAINKYIEAINAAEKAGFSVMIIDSSTHAWDGSGGLLHKADALTEVDPKHNSYTAYKKITPEQNKFVERILQANMHMILTVRSKMEYVMEKDEQTGKTAVKKIGLMPVQRNDFSYVFDVWLNVESKTHIATADDKNRYEVFQTPEVITRESGVKLLNWLNLVEAV